MKLYATCENNNKKSQKTISKFKKFLVSIQIYIPIESSDNTHIKVFLFSVK